MNNRYCSNVDDHLIFDALNYPRHQFSTGNYVPQATRLGYTNTQPAYILDDSLMINEDTYDDIREAYGNWPNSDNQPTYEENLELGERMGRVGSRLSEKTIMGHLKITSYDDVTSKRMDEGADLCVICQAEYEKGDFIGGLQCGHEYHVECVKKWLKQHNSCPICKAAAVSPNANDTRKDLPKLMMKF